MQCGIVADNTRGANMFQHEAASCTVAVYLGRPEQYEDGQAHLTNVFMINHGGGYDHRQNKGTVIIDRIQTIVYWFIGFCQLISDRF